MMNKDFAFQCRYSIASKVEKGKWKENGKKKSPLRDMSDDELLDSPGTCDILLELVTKRLSDFPKGASDHDRCLLARHPELIFHVPNLPLK